jgi:hypothetical protein
MGHERELRDQSQLICQTPGEDFVVSGRNQEAHAGKFRAAPMSATKLWFDWETECIPHRPEMVSDGTTCRSFIPA